MPRDQDHGESDSALLRRYVAEGSEDAFRALVERHANMVFSVALRRTGQWELAEEATQKVFRALAVKAADLSPDVIVAGWLHVAARCEAASLLRAESTRLKKIHEAASAAADEGVLDPVSNPSVWSELTPVIDDALEELSPDDRDVILLRFYQGLTYREIGERLGKNESAARKHTVRAVDSLSSLLKRRGVTLPAAAVGPGISIGLGAAAPHGFAEGLADSLAIPSATLSAATGAAAPIALVTTALLAAAIPVAIHWHESKAGPDAREPAARWSYTSRESPSAAALAEPVAAAIVIDLDDVFAARGAERLRLLARWLPNADAAQLRAAADRLANERYARVSSVTFGVSNPNVNLAWSAIFGRWARLDPEELVAYVRAADDDFGGMESGRYRAFSAWARVDAEAAVAAAREEDPAVLNALVASLQTTNPEGAMIAAAGIPPEARRRLLEWSALFEELASRDPEGAAERARGISDLVIREKALTGVLSAWAKQDPDAALTFAESLGGFQERASGRQAALAAMIDADPSAALDRVAALPPGMTRAVLMRSLARRLATDNPDDAQSWAASLAAPHDRRAAFSGLALAFARSDPAAAAEALDELRWNVWDLETARTSYPGGSYIASADPKNSLAAAAEAVISGLADDDPRAALRHAAKVRKGLFLGNPLKETARQWAMEDPAAAKSFAADLEPGPLKSDFAVHVATVLSGADPRAAMDWASGLGGLAGGRAAVAVFNRLAAADPASAAGSLAALPDIPEKDHAVRFLADEWARRDFDGVARWVQEHEEPDSIAPAYRTVAQERAERDPRAASEWIAKMPEGAAMEQAASGLLGWMIRQPQIDHEAAFLWAQRLTANDRHRQFYFEHIAKDWLQRDARAARAALATMDLPEELKARMIDRFGGGGQEGGPP